jgi:hypothetical protein
MCTVQVFQRPLPLVIEPCTVSYNLNTTIDFQTIMQLLNDNKALYVRPDSQDRGPGLQDFVDPSNAPVGLIVLYMYTVLYSITNIIT